MFFSLIFLETNALILLVVFGGKESSMSNFSDIFRAIFLCFLGDKIEKQKWDHIL